LRRRPARMARPARVRIRSRKPCVRARRRLFGWKVRLPLLTVDSPGRRHGTGPAAGLLNVLWTERSGPRSGSAARAQRGTVGGHRSHQGTQRLERGSNRPGPPARGGQPDLCRHRDYAIQGPVLAPPTAERGEGHPSASCGRGRLVSEAACRLACPPQGDETGNFRARMCGQASGPGLIPLTHSLIRGDPQPARQQPGPATRCRARPRTVFCTQVWTGLGMNAAPAGRRPASVALSAAMPKGVRTWPTNPATWRTCGTG